MRHVLPNRDGSTVDARGTLRRPVRILTPSPLSASSRAMSARVLMFSEKTTKRLKPSTSGSTHSVPCRGRIIRGGEGCGDYFWCLAAPRSSLRRRSSDAGHHSLKGETSTKKVNCGWERGC